MAFLNISGLIIGVLVVIQISHAGAVAHDNVVRAVAVSYNRLLAETKPLRVKP
jgi:hypothetical protein